MAEQDISRYYEKDVRESIGVGYSNRQLEQALSDFGYNEFPDNGLDDEGHGKLLQKITEIDKKESKLRKSRKKDLSSKVLEKPIKIKKEKKKSKGYLSIVEKDLGKVGG